METPPVDPVPKPRRRAPLILIGGVGALLAGGLIAIVLVSGDRGKTAPPPASESGLIVDSNTTQEGRLDLGKPLRCFVQGQYVGETSLTDCARRNGVATDALDVGIDDSGALAAAALAGQTLIPLPPEELGSKAPVVDPASDPSALMTADVCWRHTAGRWRKVGDDVGLDACVQTLFAGQCEVQGDASYGRWGSETLRRVTGRIEVSTDNRTFTPLALQAADCSIPPR